LDDVPGTALADVSARSTTLLTLLDEVGVGKAIVPPRASRFQKSSITPKRRVRHSLGHRAISRISTRLSDPEITGQLITETTRAWRLGSTGRIG
jgi:hypothetical protein